MKKSKILRCFMAVLVASLLCVNASYADAGVETNDAMMKMVKELQSQVVGLQSEIKSLRKQVKDSESVEKQVQGLESDLKKLQNAKPAAPAQVAQAVVPSWLEGTNFGGDIRLRWDSTLNNTDHTATDDGNADRHRGRARLRYGITKQVNEQLLAGFRLVTGAGALRTYYADLGTSTDGFGKWTTYIDQAYLKYTPEYVDDLTIYGGKFAQNWKTKGILIHGDMPGFEGIAESYKMQVNDSVSLEFNAAQLILAEGSGFDADSELYVVDAAAGGSFGDDMTWRLQATSYIFDGWNEASAANLAGTGRTANSATIDDPRVGVLTGDLGFSVADIPVSLWAMGGMNFNESAHGTSVRDQRKMYAFGTSLNKLANPGDISFSYKYAYVEQNSFASELISTDLGGTGTQAHIFCLDYLLFPSTTLTAAVVVPRELSAPSTATVTDKDTDVVTMKFMATTKF